MKFRLVEDILTEDIESMKQFYTNIKDEEFQGLIELDPTYKAGSTQAGVYGKWILALANRGNLSGHENHITDLLSRFHENKKFLVNKDIMFFKSVDDLESMLNNEDSYKDETARQKLRKTQKAVSSVNVEDQADLVYEDDTWEVYVPQTYEASCKLGRNTRWCTASTSSQHYYNSYSQKGKLYIHINKKDGKKYQFHHETNSWMDQEDDSIDTVEFFVQYPELLPLHKNALDTQILKDINIANLADVTNVTVYYDSRKPEAKQFYTITNNNYLYLTKRAKENVVNVEVVDGVEIIDDYAFYTCHYLKSVKIPNTVKEIGFKAFSHCKRLTYIELPDSLEIIGGYAFNQCENLSFIQLGTGIKQIMLGAFANSGIEEFFWPASVPLVPKYAFRNCRRLVELAFEEGVMVLNPHFAEGAVNVALKVFLPTTIKKFSEDILYHSSSNITWVVPSVPSSKKIIDILNDWGRKVTTER